MSTFTVPEEFAGLRLYSGGRNYEFAGVECSVEEEADAKRIRIFAVEHPEYGIAENGEAVGYLPAPEADNSGEVVAPEDPAPAAAAEEAANDDAAQTQDQIQEVLDQAHEQGILEEPADAEAAMAEGVVAAAIEERDGETVLVETVAPAPKPLERMNREELVAEAAARGVEVPERATKAQIRAALEV